MINDRYKLWSSIGGYLQPHDNGIVDVKDSAIQELGEELLYDKDKKLKVDDIVLITQPDEMQEELNELETKIDDNKTETSRMVLRKR